MSDLAKRLREWLRDNAPDCGDNSCLFGGRGKGGMRTNGGCRCYKDVLPDKRRIYIERMQAFIEAAAAIEELARDAWISVKDRLPDGSFVLAFVDDGKGHTRRIRAFYAEKFAVECGPYDEASDYCEEKDEFYLPEGWYEANEYEETHWFVHDPVTHWMPLPKPPAAIDAAQAKATGKPEAHLDRRPNLR